MHWLREKTVNHKCQSAQHWVNELWSIHRNYYYTGIKSHAEPHRWRGEGAQPSVEQKRGTQPPEQREATCSPVLLQRQLHTLFRKERGGRGARGQEQLSPHGDHSGSFSTPGTFLYHFFSHYVLLFYQNNKSVFLRRSGKNPKICKALSWARGRHKMWKRKLSALHLAAKPAGKASHCKRSNEFAVV